MQSMARIVICISINHHYQSVSDKSYSSIFCSCVCQGSKRVGVEKNHINFSFAKMHNMPKFIQSLECPYMFSDLGIFQTYLHTEMTRLRIADGQNTSKLRRNLDTLLHITSRMEKLLVSVYCKLLADSWSLNWHRKNAGILC